MTRKKNFGMSRLSLYSSIFLLFLVAILAAAPADGGQISGIITDTTGALIPGVRITVVDTATGTVKEAQTDGKGAYSILNIPAGAHSIMAELPGFQTMRYNNVPVADKQFFQLDFAMRLGAVTAPVELQVTANSGTGRIRGVVRDARNNVMSGVKVAVANTIGSFNRQMFTNMAGEYSFSNLSPGNYVLFAELPGFLTASHSNVTLADKQSLQSDFILETLTSIPPAPIAQPSIPAAAPSIGQGSGAGMGPAAGGPAGAAGGGRGGAGRGSGVGAGGSVIGGQAQFSIASSASSSSVYIAPDRSSRPNTTNTETYNRINENPFILIDQQPLATFSIDVDTASYSNVRRFLTANQTPPKDAVRIEELINYFQYDYPQASGPHPITGNIEAAAAPWNPQHRLVKIGIKAKDMPMGLKPSNLVFLIDVSGSMSTPERLPLLKSGLRLLVDRLTENDKVTIVTYAGNSGLALPPTSGDRKNDILRVIDNLQAEGSTNGGAGIELAYEQAMASFIRGGINRVILATDGDFNIGITSQNDLVLLIEDKARSGVFLSTLGVGTNNLKDAMLEQLADKGNGNYNYIDTLGEARKVLVDQMAATLVTVAKDVKIQVEFNPAQVDAYRLIGYENRALRPEDFNNDQKDAGEMGAGHTITAMFEVVPHGVAIETSSDRFSLNLIPDAFASDPRRYPQVQERKASLTPASASGEMLNLKIRYKEPEGAQSKLLEVPLVDRGETFANASTDFRFAAAVASFGMMLRDSPFKGSSNWEMVRSIASGSKGIDRNGYREEFIRLVERAAQVWRR